LQIDFIAAAPFKDLYFWIKRTKSAKTAQNADFKCFIYWFEQFFTNKHE